MNVQIPGRLVLLGALVLLSSACASSRFSVLPKAEFELAKKSRAEVRREYGSAAPAVLRETGRVGRLDPAIDDELTVLLGNSNTKGIVENILKQLDPVSRDELGAGHSVANCLAGLCKSDPVLASKVLQEVEREVKAQAAAPGAATLDSTITTSIDTIEEELKSKSLKTALEADRKDLLLEEGSFFETVTAIAFDAKLEPVAIPALAIGYRPGKDSWLVDDTCFPEGTAVELLLGGALNAQGSDSDGIELALGAGFSMPVSTNATLAFGYIRWNPDEGDIDEGMYLGITIGARPVPKAE